MSFIKYIHLAIAFLLELVMLFCLGYYGFHSGDSVLQSWAIGTGLPVAVIILWGLFAAPRAQRRLPFVFLIPFKLILFLGTALLLYHIGLYRWAILFAAISIINEILEILFHAEK